MTLEQDVPIFRKKRKEFTPSDKITHVAISNKYLIVAMANGFLFRMNLHNPQEHDGKNSFTDCLWVHFTTFCCRNQYK